MGNRISTLIQYYRTDEERNETANPHLNIQNCGINQGAGGQIKTETLTIINNPSLAGTGKTTTKPSFRFNIPTPTRHFKGRRNTMEAVRNYFITLPPQSIDCWERIVAIVGLGGMGKTETAYKFAAEFKETFPNVAWINAETESSALTSFLGLAKYLNIVSKDQKEADVDLVRQVYHHLDQEDNGRVLFIFDNAIRLNSDEEEFGIFEYLPIADLPNQRFPHVLITTQTHDWERRIETFHVNELSEEESIQFFRSCFQIISAECDGGFKNLHKLLQGFPLVMNLAASQFDYNPKKHSVHQLQQQIRGYINKLETEQTKILHEKMNRAWPTKYTKILSNVWQLTFERIQQEDNGHDALELLQFMSFHQIPIKSHEVASMLAHNSDCPHPPKKKLELRVKELFRVLERFYTVRLLEIQWDDDEGFRCQLGIHRLVQLVVRQQMDSRKFERVLFYLASDYDPNDRLINSALDEALRRSQLSQRAMHYVGVIACWGVPAACKWVETRQPETKAADTIWRLYKFERGMVTLNENATQVLNELIGLAKSEKQPEDRYLFAKITIRLLAYWRYFHHMRDDGTHVSGYFYLDSLQGVEELVADLILNVCSVYGSSCKSNYCPYDCKKREDELSILTVMLAQTFVQADSPKSTITADVIAQTWFALLARLRNYEEHIWPAFLHRFSRDIYKIFHSPGACRLRIDDLRKSLWDRGLALELIRVFEFTSRCLPHLKHYSDSPVLELMDVCMDGMDLRDERVQQVMSAFCHMITTIEVEFISKDHCDATEKWKNFAVELCSVWIKLFLMDGDEPSQKLLQSLSGLKFLDWIARSPKLNTWKRPMFSFRHYLIPFPVEYLSKYFPQFIHKFESSEIKAIKTLANVCQRIMEDN